MFQRQLIIYYCLFCCCGMAYSAGGPSPEAAGVSDCGPHCIRYLARYYGREVTLEKAYDLCEFNPSTSKSTNMLQLKKACENLGLKCLGIKGPLEVINEPAFSQCSFIVQVEKDGFGHFVVIVKGKQYNSWIMLDPFAKKSVSLSSYKGAVLNILLVSNREIPAASSQADKQFGGGDVTAVSLSIFCFMIFLLVCVKKRVRN